MGIKMDPSRFSKANAWAWKPIVICLVIIMITVGITAFFTVGDGLEEEMQTEECQMALNYLQSQPHIIEKYGSETPKLVSHHYEYQNGIPAVYTYTFVYNWIPVLNLGDKYTVELNYIDEQWVVVE